MIIDAFTHGLHGKYLDQMLDAGGEWAKNTIKADLELMKDRRQYLDVALRVEQLDRYGIDYQVVTPSIRMNIQLFRGDDSAMLAFAKAYNENMARVMEDSKGRLPAVGTIPLAILEQGGLQEMERVIKELGLKGIFIASNIAGKPLDSPGFETFWAKAAELDIPVFIHPAHPVEQKDRSYESEYDMIHNFGWPFETTLMLSRIVFSGLIERYPTLKIVSHHLGGMIPFFWGRILETYAPENQQKKIGRVLSKPLFDYFSKFYYDTAVGGNAAAVRCAYEVFGPDRLIFATDAPFGPEHGVGRLGTYQDVVRSLELPEAENEKIFSGNISKVLDLS